MFRPGAGPQFSAGVRVTRTGMTVTQPRSNWSKTCPMHDCYGQRAASKALNGADERDDDGDEDGDGGRGKDNVDDDDDDEDGDDGDGDDSDCEDVHGAGAVAQTGQTPTPTGQ